MPYTVFNYKKDETCLYLVIYYANIYWIPTVCWEPIYARYFCRSKADTDPASCSLHSNGGEKIIKYINKMLIDQ